MLINCNALFYSLKRENSTTLITKKVFQLKKSQTFNNGEAASKQRPNKQYLTPNGKSNPDIHHSVSLNDLKPPATMMSSSNEKLGGSARQNSKKAGKNSTPMLTSIQHMKRVANNERKSLKVLVIMFTIFITLWCPFFVLNTLSALFEDFIRVYLAEYEYVVYFVFTWLGYFSSMLNPIVYTMFNKAFRTAFINILKCELKQR